MSVILPGASTPVGAHTGVVAARSLPGYINSMITRPHAPLSPLTEESAGFPVKEPGNVQRKFGGRSRDRKA